MLQRALDKENMKRFVAAMLREGRVLGPVPDVRGVVLGNVSDTSGLRFDFANFQLPPKREFFPQCEVICRYDAKGVTEEVMDDENVVVFGVRPCDAQALAYLDKVFGDGPSADPYYQTKRDNTLVISLACERPASVCFCSSTGGGPAGKSGTDIIAFHIGGGLLFEAVSAKGEAFLTKNDDLFRASTSEEVHRRNQQESDSLKQLHAVPVSKAVKSLQHKNDPLMWNMLSETCLSCGACTYLCPTCHCFGVYDEKQEEGGRRLRVHDACMFASFVREASGHNPRSKPGERMRQRVMHKFSYAPENYGDIFCVGCGRCIVNCPSNIDIRETLTEATL